MSEPMTLSRADPTLRFSIHPLAHAAYQWILTYPRFVSWKNLPGGLTSQLLRQPLQGVMFYQQGKNKKMRPTEFLLFSPLWPALYWEAPYPPEGTLLIHNTPSHVSNDADIEQQAWASALSLLVMSIDSRELAALRESFQAQLPRHMAQYFFDKSQVSDADLCLWTGCSRGTLVQQRRRAVSNTPVANPLADPIALLDTDWSPDHG